jgi:hypothetical protein
LFTPAFRYIIFDHPERAVRTTALPTRLCPDTTLDSLCHTSIVIFIAVSIHIVDFEKDRQSKPCAQ